MHWLQAYLKQVLGLKYTATATGQLAGFHYELKSGGADISNATGRTDDFAESAIVEFLG